MNVFRKPRQSQSTLAGSLYALGGNLLLNVLSLARGILIARLLVPSEVGRFALVSAVLGGLETMTYPGLYDAVIQARSPNRRMLSVAWTLLICRGFALGAILFLSADLVAQLLAQPDLSGLIRGISVVPVVLATISMSLPLRRREMDVRSVTVTNLWEAAVNTVVSLAAAYSLRSASALVVGAVAGAAVKSLSSYTLGDFRPRISFALGEVRELIGFSRWRFLWGTFWYLSTQLDNLVIGRVLGVQPLGVYKIAYRIAYFPASASSSALSQVVFPSIARKFRETSDAAITAYFRYVSLVASFALPVAMYVAAVSHPLVHFLLGSAWRAAGTPIAIISIAAAVRALTGTGSSLFLAAGRPELDSAMEAARALALALGLLLVIPFGLEGAAMAVVLSSLAAVPVWAHGCRTVGSRASPLGVVARRLPIASVPSLIAIPLVLTASPLALPISAPLGLTCYILVMRRYDPRLWQEWLELARSVPTAHLKVE